MRGEHRTSEYRHEARRRSRTKSTAVNGSEVASNVTEAGSEEKSFVAAVSGRADQGEASTRGWRQYARYLTQQHGLPYIQYMSIVCARQFCRPLAVSTEPVGPSSRRGNL
jgi:hypothetical protein